MVDYVVAGTFLSFCRLILSHQIAGDEPWRLVGGLNHIRVEQVLSKFSGALKKILG
jgi:hypothetical protein